MPDNDLDYYEQRAEAELRRAQQAANADAGRAHAALARAYRERVAQIAPRAGSLDA